MRIIKMMTGIALVLAMTACKKEAGPKGDTGPAGTNGVANITTTVINTTNGSWIFDSTDNSWNATLSASGITSSVVSGGDVKVYIGDGSSTAWAALPFSYGNLQYNYTYQAGSVIVSVNTSNFASISNPGGQQFKVVIVPPAFKKNNPDVNWNNYQEVKSKFNILD